MVNKNLWFYKVFVMQLGEAMKMKGNPLPVIYLLCKRQKTIALSTTEAEFMAMVAAIQESIWLKRLELELFPNSTKSMDLHCDNRGAIQLATNNSFSSRTKHIDIKEKFIRETLQSGNIKLKYLRTNEMPADILTKPTSGQKLAGLLNYFGFY